MVTLESGLHADTTDFDNAIDTDLSVEEKKFFLNVAYSIVHPLLHGEGVGENTLARIEAEVAADAASSKDPRIYRERVGDALFDYQRVEDETDHWQLAVAMDPTGKLQGAKSGRATLRSFGPGRD